MGGRAFVETLGKESSRLDVNEYKHIYNTLSEYTKPILAYRTKPNFGDIDVVADFAKRDFVHESIDSDFNIIKTTRNGNITSYAISIDDDNYFQIDVIYLDKDKIEFAYKYFSYNDLGNLLGRLARRIGLKLGFDGLYYPHRIGDHFKEEYLLSRDWNKVLLYLGLSPFTYDNGFDTLDDIFEFVVSSKYFDPNSFILSERNAKARIRDIKRPSYRKFLEYIEDHDPMYFYLPDKETYLHQHCKQFPYLKANMEMTLDLYETNIKVSKRINGHYLMKRYNVKGKELGALIKTIRSMLSNDKIINMTDDELESELDQIFAFYRIEYNV